LFDRRLEIAGATKLRSFAPTPESISTDPKELSLFPEFGRISCQSKPLIFFEKDQKELRKFLRSSAEMFSGSC
jgi:hypothetical protein